MNRPITYHIVEMQYKIWLEKIKAMSHHLDHHLIRPIWVASLMSYHMNKGKEKVQRYELKMIKTM